MSVRRNAGDLQRRNPLHNILLDQNWRRWNCDVVNNLHSKETLERKSWELFLEPKTHHAGVLTICKNGVLILNEGALYECVESRVVGRNCESLKPLVRSSAITWSRSGCGERKRSICVMWEDCVGRGDRRHDSTIDSQMIYEGSILI